MKSKVIKQQEAFARQAGWLNIPFEKQLMLLDERLGKKQRAKIAKLLS